MKRQCVVFSAPRQIDVVEEALAQGRRGQLLVRTEVSAISPGTEMLFYRGEAPAGVAIDSALSALGQNEVQYPLRYGYSCVGQVIDVAGEPEGDWLKRRVCAVAP